MEPPLQVAADEDGIFRDVHDRPMIMVFNSTQKDAKAIEKVFPESKASGSQPKLPLMFVQVSGSKKEDRKERTKIRTHVMQDHFRRKREVKTPRKRPQSPEPSGELIQASGAATNVPFEICPLHPQPTGSLDPFVQYPIQMKPQSYRLVHHYLTTIAPTAQPSDFGWSESFETGMRDPAVFHVILLSAAVHLNFINNNFTSADTVYHKLKAIQSMNEKLKKSPNEVSDDMLHVVMFMAMAEGVGGDHAAAKAHLDGLNRMVEIRGGFETLNPVLQQKICLADYLCCVEPDERPRFRFPFPSKALCLDKTAPANVEAPIGFRTLETIVALDQELLDILTDVEHFCIKFRQMYRHEVKKKVGPHDYDVTAIRYRLLCMENARRTITHKELIGDACRVGTLVFIKTVFDQFGCWGPSHKVWGRPYKFLVEKLKVYLTRLDSTTDAPQTECLEFLLWLSFMGGVLQLEYVNRTWYNSFIAMTAAKLGLCDFDGVKEVLSRFLWIEWVHERPCMKLWEDIMEDPEMRNVAPPGWGIAAQCV